MAQGQRTTRIQVVTVFRTGKAPLKFEIHGAPANSDDAVFETKLLTLTTEMLMPIMGWQSEADAVHSYLLTREQANAIERLTTIPLPKDLELYISCHC
ncbi:pyocin S6 family toxin immunity protein [Pseudomonas chlororaphis]|uniref:pyocin S6 family toxin immunity protein n=1 Tax=Pseudomonas chlororaphis TaxID=587753 RepID=UPI00294FFC9D|nr:pyocin S6 family toxin immunity protein [Pseudomonas chlororaphis]